MRVSINLKLLTGLALATLSVSIFIGHVSTIGPKHAKFPRDATMFARGGRTASSQNIYDMLNKWVVLLRRTDMPTDLPEHNNLTSFPNSIDYLSLGYGLYFRRPGYMLVNVKNLIAGTKRDRLGRMMMSGHYIDYNEKDRYAPRTNDSSPMIYRPYLLTDIKHLYTYPSSSLGLIRVSLNGYRGYYKPANGGQAYSRYLDYPNYYHLPWIAEPKDKKDVCYIVIHDYFEGEKMGYNQYKWKYWPVKKDKCVGPICSLRPVAYEENKYPSLPDRDNDAGWVCNNIQDRGAPIFCHTENKKLFSNDGTDTATDEKWKLSYWLIGPDIGGLGGCNTVMKAFDLSTISDILYDPEWDKNLEWGIW